MLWSRHTLWRIAIRQRDDFQLPGFLVVPVRLHLAIECAVRERQRVAGQVITVQSDFRQLLAATAFAFASLGDDQLPILHRGCCAVLLGESRYEVHVRFVDLVSSWHIRDHLAERLQFIAPGNITNNVCQLGFFP